MASTVRVKVMIIRSRSGTSLNELELTDSEASFMPRRPSFFPVTRLKKEVKVTSPKPPTWMSAMMTPCPNRLQWVYVS